MELSNEFTVGVPVGEAWKVLTDVERIAPCLPGTELQEVEGEEVSEHQRPAHRSTANAR
jgi:carbon monoxide dehydrogenase subunit G